MSKLVHKVKDAMADHDKDAPNTSQFQAPHDTYASSKPPTAEHSSNQYSSSNMNPSAGMGSANPYGPGPHRDSRFNDTHNTDNPINTGMGNMSSHSNPDTYGSTAMGGDGSTNTTNNSSSGMNAGPHKSKLANKMDPRVDSDMDNRARQAETVNPQHSPNAARTSGIDNHVSSEDDYNKSTQESKSQSQHPDNYGPSGQWTSEETHKTSTQEHKSHSTTSHNIPCETNLQSEPGLNGGTTGPNFSGNAAGGSSYTSGNREASRPQNVDQMNKLDPRSNQLNEQANLANQRGGY